MSISDTASTPSRPLDGLRVIDFSRVLAGPLIGQTLGDLGADVIKVERPGHGDDTRTWGPPWHEDQATYYLSLNRNKRSIVLDLKDEEDVAFARRLALTGDVILDNFKPGFMADLGLDRRSLSKERPEIVTATITAFGAGTDAADLPGYDLVAQAMGGLMHLTGESDGRPLRVGVPIVDMMTGLNATIGVLAALTERAATGVGRHVEVALFDTAVASLLNHHTSTLMGGSNPVRGGNRHPSIAPYESFSASDGDLIIAAANDKLFAGLCRAIERPALCEDERYANNTARAANADSLISEINQALAHGTRAEWINKLRAQDVPCGPINSIPEALAWGADIGADLELVAGSYHAVRSPIRIDGVTNGDTTPPPRLGEHSEQIRREIDGL